jgi:hypothetical protein
MNLLVWLPMVLSTAAFAADAHFILPAAVGSGDGSSWENAAAATALPTLLDGGLTPGAVLHIGSGTYSNLPLTVKLAGTAEAPITITGEDTGGGIPLVQGTWKKEKPTEGAHGFVIAPGTEHVNFEKMAMNAVYRAFYTPEGGLTSVSWSDIAITNVRTGFYLLGSKGGQHRSYDLAIRRCSIVGYTKRGVRLEMGNQHVVIEDCLADSGGREWAVEAFPMSFHVLGDMSNARREKVPARETCSEDDIVFRRCTAKNNWHVNGDKYWNADGFCGEGGNTRVRYIDCVATGNTDGGWDDKSVAPVLIRCHAENNKRNYRFWSKIAPVTFVGCTSSKAYKFGGSGDALGLWLGGPALLIDCTFSDNPKDVGYNDEPVWIGVENSTIRIPQVAPHVPAEAEPAAE